MGREFKENSDDVEFESYHPGCMGGILNVLDYHHWYHVKRMLPRRKHNRGRRHVRCCANPQTISMERESVETQGLLDGEADQIQVQQQTRKTGSKNKSSGKEKLKEESHKHWILGISGRPQLQQTDSTHHMEPSGYGLGWMNPIVLVRKRVDTSDTSSGPSLPETAMKQVMRSKMHIHDRVNADNHLEHRETNEKHAIFKTPVSKKLKREASYNQVKERVDVLEIFKVNKDLFLDILQDPEVGLSQHFPGKQSSQTVKLTKSVSFPVPDSPRTRCLRSSTLEHKQMEFWSFKKGEKSLPATQFSKSSAFRTDGATSSISQGSDSQRWNHLVMNRLKQIKQRIKHALKERRKSVNHTMVDGLTLQVSSRDALSIKEIEISESLEKTTMEQDCMNNLSSSLQTDASDHGISNARLNRVRRTKSINESLDRYTQLFEHSVNKEADLHHSKSLKLTTEDKIPSRRRAPKFFRRISSLSDLESFCSLLNEVTRDALSSEMSIRSILNYEPNKESNAHNEPQSISFPEDMDKFELVEAVLEAELQEKIAEGNNRSSTSLSVDRNHEEIAKPCDFDEDIIEQAMEKSSPLQEQESVFAVNSSRELSEPTSNFSDITSGVAERPMQDGLNHPNLPAEEAEFVEYETMGVSSRFLFFESDKDQADPCYNYVRDILELSGFIQNDDLQTWYSADQPLNPSFFKELEALLHPELEYYMEEVGSNCDHQLVFDLVNEALLEIGEKSSIYFPKPFSFNRQISLMLEGNNALQEVWTKVSRNLGWQPESDQSLDDIVAQDLAKDASLNLQTESEFVALELEDLIFDELLVEFFDCISVIQETYTAS